MRNPRIKTPDTVESEPFKTSEPEMDYSPKTTSKRDQIIFGIKLFAISGAFFLMLYLYEKF